MTRRMSDADRVKLITARRVAEAVTLVVNELPQGEGAPGHALYAGIIAFLSISEFETMMRGLVFASRVRRRPLLPRGGSMRCRSRHPPLPVRPANDVARPLRRDFYCPTDSDRLEAMTPVAWIAMVSAMSDRPQAQLTLSNRHIL